MMNIRLIAVGGIKETFYEQAISEYMKRLTKYCKIEIIEIKEGDIKSETDAIKQKLRGQVVLFDVGGRQVSSVEFSDLFFNLGVSGSSSVTLVVGGSHGVGNYLDGVASEKISFGRITYPHQLFRVVLVEQIYRAFTIIRGERYHK
jgi:23S rRNA (pseudouridine1915-N3)-methyltransferase